MAKQLGGREFVDAASDRLFNELRGHFYDQGGFRSSADQPALVRIVESGPLRATAEIAGTIGGHPFVQRVSLTQGSPVIDCSVRIDWRGNPRIGEFEEKDGYRNRRRPAYDDRYKLLVLFPARLAGQKIAKDAPFDVCESKLADTFYNSWEGIKNNVILDWVDVADGTGDHGLALFSDHTTSYAHGPELPSGPHDPVCRQRTMGARLPRRRADRSPLCADAARRPVGRGRRPGLVAAWQEPPWARTARGGQRPARSLVDPGASGWAVPAMYERDGKLLVRLFNASGVDAAHDLGIGFEAGKIEIVELDGRVVDELKPTVDGTGRRTIRLRIPRFGIRTLRFSGLKCAQPI